MRKYKKIWYIRICKEIGEKAGIGKIEELHLFNWNSWYLSQVQDQVDQHSSSWCMWKKGDIAQVMRYRSFSCPWPPSGVMGYITPVGLGECKFVLVQYTSSG